MLTKTDIIVLRQLAQQYAGYAFSPLQAEKRRLWIKLNSLNMERPLLTIDQIPWNEMDVDGSLVCAVADPYWRSVEWDLRTTLYKLRHMPGDTALNQYICIPRPIFNTGWGIESRIKSVISLEKDSTAPSRVFENQITCMDDLEKIKTPVITLDSVRESEIINEADEIFGGIIPYRLTGMCMHLGIWDWIAQWMGVENCYIAIMDEPEMIHALMEKLTNGVLSMIDQMNAQKLFDVTSNLCHCSHTFSGSESEPAPPAVSENAWAFGLAQLFTCVSPSVTDEFEVQYVSRIFPHFSNIYYGCCDRLDDRMDVIRKLPKIKKLSCSPWSDREHFARVMPDTCIMSAKPNPAYLAAGALDEDAVRKDLRRTICAARECGRNLELLLKDISTVSHNPASLWRWQEICMEEITR